MTITSAARLPALLLLAGLACSVSACDNTPVASSAGVNGAQHDTGAGPAPQQVPTSATGKPGRPVPGRSAKPGPAPRATAPTHLPAPSTAAATPHHPTPAPASPHPAPAPAPAPQDVPRPTPTSGTTSPSTPARPPVVVPPNQVDLKLGTPVSCHLARSTDPFDPGTVNVSARVTLTPPGAALTYSETNEIDGTTIAPDYADRGSASWRLTRVPHPAGPHTVLLSLDPRHEIAENDESNNRILIYFSLPPHVSLQPGQVTSLPCSYSFA